jgi:hypothetical protein
MHTPWLPTDSLSVRIVVQQAVVQTFAQFYQP